MEKIIKVYYQWLVGKTIKIASLAGPGNYKVENVATIMNLDEETLIITLKRLVK